jgi:uncharacterized LabA/DUF88 family protein
MEEQRSVPEISSDEAAMERINALLAHIWMVRTFLKHSDEFEEEIELLAIPRALFDYARALEASYRDRDVARYLKLARNKLKRIQAASAQFSEELADISDHTNFKMAEYSLRLCVEDIEKVLTALE